MERSEDQCFALGLIPYVSQFGCRFAGCLAILTASQYCNCFFFVTVVSEIPTFGSEISSQSLKIFCF